MTYDRADRNAFALAAGTGEMRKAAGLPTYQVPFCGAGFAGHFRSTQSGKCVSCGPVRVVLAQAKATAAKKERKAEEAKARQLAHNLNQSINQKPESKTQCLTKISLSAKTAALPESSTELRYCRL